MNLRGGLAVVQKSLFSYTSSRGFFWTLAFGWMMPPLIFMFMWAAAAGGGDIGGFARNDFIIYYICLVIINQLTYPTSHWIVGESITNGSMSKWLLWPVPPIYHGLAGDLATKAVCMPFAFAVAGLVGVVTRVQFTLSARLVPLFLLALVLALALRFLFGYTLALLAFWTQQSEAILAVNDTLVFLLAGQMIPAALLPGVMQDISIVLPYRYMLDFPVQVLMGSLQAHQVLSGLVIQTAWLVLVLLLHQFVWSRGIKKYTSVGG